jgi:hypothetical protein
MKTKIIDQVSNRCDGCQKLWLGKFWNVSFCNDCKANGLPDHDCPTQLGDGCDVCVRFYAELEPVFPPEHDERERQPMTEDDIDAMAKAAGTDSENYRNSHG